MIKEIYNTRERYEIIKEMKSLGNAILRGRDFEDNRKQLFLEMDVLGVMPE